MKRKWLWVWAGVLFLLWMFPPFVCLYPHRPVASLGILDYPRCGSTLAGPSGITASSWVSSPFGYGLYGCWAGGQRRERAEQISDEIPGLQRANPNSGFFNSL